MDVTTIGTAATSTSVARRGRRDVDLTSDERVQDREFELDATNHAPRGVWSDGSTAWVSAQIGSASVPIPWNAASAGLRGRAGPGERGCRYAQNESARYNLAHPFSHDRSFIPMFMPW